MTANEIYQLPVQRVEKGLWELEDHFPECNYDDFHQESVAGLEIRIFHYENFDGERYWQLAGVYLDGFPFMLIQNAGRGGRDHKARFVTAPTIYLDAVKRIRKNETPEDVVDPEAELPQLSEFYGCKFNDFYDPTLTPRYKVGDVVRAMVLENHCNYTNKRIPTRVEITAVYPTHPKNTYHGRQLDRAWVGKGIETVEPGKGSIGANFNDEQVLEVLKP